MSCPVLFQIHHKHITGETMKEHFLGHYGGVNWQPVNQMEQLVQHVNQLERNLVDNLSINQSAGKKSC